MYNPSLTWPVKIEVYLHIYLYGTEAFVVTGVSMHPTTNSLLS